MAVSLIIRIDFVEAVMDNYPVSVGQETKKLSIPLHSEPETMSSVMCNCEAGFCNHYQGYCANSANNYVYTSFAGRVCPSCAERWEQNSPESLYCKTNEED